MRRLFLVVLLLALTGTSQAIDIKGKWGLGVGTGERGLPTEASVIRGKTTRTAWILNISGYQSLNEHENADYGTTNRYLNVGLGPGFRRYTRPLDRLSPYWDFNLNFAGGRTSYTANYPPPGNSYKDIGYTVGSGASMAVGVEYFTPWHFSIVAHSHFVDLSLTREWVRHEGRTYNTRWTETVNLNVAPYLRLRVYF